MSTQDFVLMECQGDEDQAALARQIMLLERHIHGHPTTTRTPSAAKAERRSSKNVPLDDIPTSRKPKSAHRLVWR